MGLSDHKPSLAVWIVTLGVGESVTKDVGGPPLVVLSISNEFVFRILKHAVEQSTDHVYRNIVILRVKWPGVS